MDDPGEGSTQAVPLEQPSQPHPVQTESDKRRRKKPTLNCSACVARKTKCGRNRPTCRQCIRRQSECVYSDIANIIVELGPDERPRRRRTSTAVKRTPPDMGSLRESVSSNDQYGYATPKTGSMQLHPLPDTSRLGVQPAAIHTVNGVFENNTEHPFHNYWTLQGGLREVLAVLPVKDQAMAFTANFFESIDPLYPILSQSDLMEELEAFWGLTAEETLSYDASKLALHFVVYAAGVSYVESIDPDERSGLADFYLSASYQSLCLCSYMSRFSLATVQTIVLIGYLLINTNRFSEAWTFSGILVRQACGTQLHRHPDAISPTPEPQQRLTRRKLWQAVVIQDTTLAYYLKLPPSALFCDFSQDQVEQPSSTMDYGMTAFFPRSSMHPDLSPVNDATYLECLWQYSLFIQENIAVPIALGRPLSNSASHKASLVAKFNNMYNNWKAPFNNRDPKRFWTANSRLARQLIHVASNCFGILTVLHIDENAGAGVFCDVYGAIDASHEALSAFFALFRLCPKEMDMWGSYLTRAYAQATRLAKVLVGEVQRSNGPSVDPRLKLAKSDLDRYMDILHISKGSGKHRELQQVRLRTLRSIIDSISIT